MQQWNKKYAITTNEIFLYQAMVNNLPEQRLRELAVQMVDAYPSIMHNLLEPVGRQPGSGYHPPSGSACPSWCICGHCREMPSQEERVCCGMNPVCISTVPVGATFNCLSRQNIFIKAIYI